MSRAIGIDFLARPARPPFAGAVLLSVAAAATALLAWQYGAGRADLARLEESIEALNARSAAPRQESAARLVSQGGIGHEAVQGVVRELSTPWSGLFAAVERAVGEHVALLGMQPEAANGRVTITAEARNISEALWFAQRLSESGVLAEAFLTAHEVRAQGALRPVRFTVSARWTPMEIGK